MGLWASVKRDVTFVRRLGRIFARIRDIAPDSVNLVCDDIEKVCDAHPNAVAVSCEGQSLTYQQFEALSNRFAHWAKARGLKSGDTVAIILPNRLEYLPLWIGLSKIGVVSALINNALTGKSLAHCVNVSNAACSIVDPSTLDAFLSVQSELTRRQPVWCLDIDRDAESEAVRSLRHALKGVSSVRPDRGLRDGIVAKKTALYIYTSGTTGLPKAARITHTRAQLYMKAFAGLARMKSGDKIYNVLPLYHATGGLCGVGAALMNGAEVIVKKRFSASSFWGDIVKAGATHIVYIGELCRYLVNSPPSPNPKDETRHKIKMVFGNGMRPEIWKPFQKRFRIKNIVEFYGSTEGNVSLFNLDGKEGAIGRVPRLLKSRFNIRIVRFNIESEEPERRMDGLCTECKPGEVGEAIGEIAADARHHFAGYADKSASAKKVLTNVFKKGDQWFRTGDLMRKDKDGYIYFVDRIGDTFRFKGENVSTSEVAEYAASCPNVSEAIIYGVPVPHHDGKAGMAALIVREGFDIHEFYRHLEGLLPAYARPRFVRLLTEVDTTGTFKYKKTDLVNEGYDINRLTDTIYIYVAPDGYHVLTRELLYELTEGRLKL